ncbi:GntR family transcriptional regulator [Bacillus thuringiensis]|uniref:GntR family transcriptional regulator n=1 Tax=Bacillus thuringiensis TaxID=1428 RepID=UPI002AB43C0F|nr:GntR family transcriptional regulator [Bacillus thuringiensis]MDY8166495.1 GntR family transcriptional regulator [Bacillus thuringiensis]
MSTSLIDTAYTTIRQQILSCEYMPGSLLSIYKLAEELEMSRTPISNAIARLELEGLVVTLKNRGVMVKEISMKEIIEMFEVTFAHQMYVLDTVENFEHYTFNLTDLKSILDQQLIEKEQNNYFKYASLSLSFIRSFIATTKNNVMMHIMDAHQDKIIMNSVANYKLFPQQRYFSGAHYNWAIYQALSEENYEEVRKLIYEWRQKTRERVVMMGSI